MISAWNAPRANDAWQARATEQPRERQSGRLRYAIEPWEIESALRIRREVFVHEQGVFDYHDRDRFDALSLNIIALQRGSRSSCVKQVGPDHADRREPVEGTVRLHRGDFPAHCSQAVGDERVWWGSRLAIVKAHRGAAATAAGLIRKAVASAVAIGCDRFFAHIQPQNRRLFARLGWNELAFIRHENLPHLLVEADLERFDPAILLTETEVAWARYLHSQTASSNHDQRLKRCLRVEP
ncbi:MAG: MSMEG_0567/Sll0786 family nitrogen starvation N-acetyltransferase [Planctomycetota bacterium]